MTRSPLRNIVHQLMVVSICFTPTLVFSQDVLFSEDFEGVPLGESVEEQIFEDEVWAATYEGWTVENMVPGQDEDEDFNGVTEWIGWTFADKEWWIDTAGDQRRSEFSLGDGTVMVADPDEWDDQDHPNSADEGWYNTYITAPAIDINGVGAGTIELQFDSSWRDEFDDNYQQSGNITVQYDDGEPIEVLRWLSDPDSEFFKDDIDPEESTDEQVLLKLDNPAGARSLSITFGMFDAGNDWWWAIDNIIVRGAAGQGLTGDYNENGELDAGDLDLQAAGIQAGDLAFDLNGDGATDFNDRLAWVRDGKSTWIGDANLDGEFNSSDFVSVFTAGLFETGLAARWGEGDWNGDGVFSSGDFVAAFTDGGFELGPRVAANVPEPTGVAAVGLVGIGLLYHLRRRKS